MMESVDFSKVSVLVVGDVMLDKYCWGSVTRISPEAPVPVVRIEGTSVAAGGAANVAANITGLGASVILIGSLGDDDDAGQFPDVLGELAISADYLIRMNGRRTTVKTRVVAHSQHVVRLDHETVAHLTEAEQDAVIEAIDRVIGGVDVVLISDYAKGLLTYRILRHLIDRANALTKPVLVDPKGKNFEKYRGATMITPNRREAAEACGMDDLGTATADEAGQRLLNDLGLRAVLVTQGEDGMSLFTAGADVRHMSAVAREVYDVTGAGDTVIATLAVAVGAGISFWEAAKLANAAAGHVVEQVGTTAITLNDLKKYIGEPTN